MSHINNNEVTEFVDNLFISLMGPENYGKWQHMKCSMQFSSEKSFISWLLELASSFTEQQHLQYDVANEPSNDKYNISKVTGHLMRRYPQIRPSRKKSKMPTANNFQGNQDEFGNRDNLEEFSSVPTSQDTQNAENVTGGPSEQHAETYYDESEDCSASEVEIKYESPGEEENDVAEEAISSNLLVDEINEHVNNLPLLEPAHNAADGSNLSATDQEYRDSSKSSRCDICNKILSCRPAMIRHKRHVHYNIRPHQCSKCLRQFPQKQNLDKHVCSI